MKLKIFDKIATQGQWLGLKATSIVSIGISSTYNDFSINSNTLKHIPGPTGLHFGPGYEQKSLFLMKYGDSRSLVWFKSHFDRFY